MGLRRKCRLRFIQSDLQLTHALARPVFAAGQFSDHEEGPDENRYGRKGEETGERIKFRDLEGGGRGAAALQKYKTGNRGMTHNCVQDAVAFPHFFSGHLRDAARISPHLSHPEI